MINQEWCLFSCKVASNAVIMNFYEVTVAKVPEQTDEKLCVQTGPVPKKMESLTGSGRYTLENPQGLLASLQVL